MYCCVVKLGDVCSLFYMQRKPSFVLKQNKKKDIFFYAEAVGFLERLLCSISRGIKVSSLAEECTTQSRSVSQRRRAITHDGALNL